MIGTARSATVMLVEDSEADVDLLKFCLRKNKIHVDLLVFGDGEEAMDHLLSLKDEPSKKRPDIILLDINLPGKNGIELLHDIKEDESIKAIPVVMLTSSKHDEDIINSYTNHASCFLQKPLDIQSFQKIMHIFEEFWFTIVTLPEQ